MKKAESRNRHQEFIQSIFINLVENQKKETEKERSQTLDELLSGIFDNPGILD